MVTNRLDDLPQTRAKAGFQRAVPRRNAFFLLDLHEPFEDVRQHLVGLALQFRLNLFFDGLDVCLDRSGDPPHVLVHAFAQFVIPSLLKELVEDKGQQRQIGRVRTRIMNQAASRMCPASSGPRIAPVS